MSAGLFHKLFNILKRNQPDHHGKREEEEGSKLYEDIEGRYTDEFVWKELEVEASADTAEAEEDEERQGFLFNEEWGEAFIMEEVGEEERESWGG